MRVRARVRVRVGLGFGFGFEWVPGSSGDRSLSMLLPRCPGCTWLKQLVTDTCGAPAGQFTRVSIGGPGFDLQAVRMVWYRPDRMLSSESAKLPYIHSRSGLTSHRPKTAQLAAISHGTTVAAWCVSGDGAGDCGGGCWAARPKEVRTRAEGTALRIRGRTRERSMICRLAGNVRRAGPPSRALPTRRASPARSSSRSAAPVRRAARRRRVGARSGASGASPRPPAYGSVGHAAAAADSG